MTGIDDLLELLPTRVAELVDVIGLSAALKLVETHGGTHIWVPKRAKPEHWLASHIGFEAFEKCCWYYGDTSVEIDRCSAALRAIKDKTIADEFNNGLTNSQLARKHDTTERTIRRIKRRVKDTLPSPNLDLFADLLGTSHQFPTDSDTSAIPGSRGR